MPPVRLGRFAGLEFSAERSIFAATFVLWLVLVFLAMGLFNLPFPQAVLGALIAVVLHWISGALHQLGHAWAARRTGHPMIGVRAWGLLGTSLYPIDEPALPGAIHIRRALGGPMVSFGVTIIAAIVLAIVAPRGGTLTLLAKFFFFENLLIFTIGSLLPFGFTDGSTLLQWWGK